MSESKPTVNGKKFTPFERKVMDFYMLDANKAKAFRDAGYKGKLPSVAAQQFFRRKDIAAELNRRMDERSKRVEIDQDLVLQGVVNLIKNCEEGLVYNKDGSIRYVEDPITHLPVPLRRVNVRDALKGYELLGKHLRIFTEQVEVHHSGSVGVEHTVEAMGFSDLLRLAESKQQAFPGVDTERPAIEAEVIQEEDPLQS